MNTFDVATALKEIYTDNNKPVSEMFSTLLEDIQNNTAKETTINRLRLMYRWYTNTKGPEKH